jgi:hypothetical protein
MTRHSTHRIEYDGVLDVARGELLIDHKCPALLEHCCGGLTLGGRAGAGGDDRGETGYQRLRKRSHTFTLSRGSTGLRPGRRATST